MTHASRPTQAGLGAQLNSLLKQQHTGGLEEGGCTGGKAGGGGEARGAAETWKN